MPKNEGKEEKIKLVKMIRDEGEPKTADVHPDMVMEYQKGGWRIAEEK